MANTEIIEAALAKGPAITAADVQGIERELALMPLDDAHEIEPWVWEGVSLIVNDPAYSGDATVSGE